MGAGKRRLGQPEHAGQLLPERFATGDEIASTVVGVGADRPFLLSLHFNAPHWPWVAHGDEVEDVVELGHFVFCD